MMPDDSDDLDKMSADELRKLKGEVLLRIEEEGAFSSSTNSLAAEDIQKLDELLNDIEVRLADLDNPPPPSPRT
jgi:hypothetical protein